VSLASVRLWIPSLTPKKKKRERVREEKKMKERGRKMNIMTMFRISLLS
jgi:hypothetical protein